MSIRVFWHRNFMLMFLMMVLALAPFDFGFAQGRARPGSSGLNMPVDDELPVPPIPPPQMQPSPPRVSPAPQRGRGGRQAGRNTRNRGNQNAQQQQQQVAAQPPDCSCKALQDIARQNGAVHPQCAHAAQNCGIHVDQKELQAEQSMSQCEAEAENAESVCMTEPDDGYGAATSAAEQLTQGLGMSGVCGQVGKAVNVASASLLALKANCALEHDQCGTACEGARADISQLAPAVRGQFQIRLTHARQTCARASARLRGIENQIAGLAQQVQQAERCKQDSTNANSNLPTVENCRANPGLPGCAAVLGQDCSNSEIARTNLACICQANPNHAKCGYSKVGAASIGGPRGIDGTGSSGSEVGAAGGINGDGFDPGGMGAESMQMDPVTGAPSKGFSGGGGGGGGGRGGGLGAGNKPHEKYVPPAKKPLNTAVNAGNRGGAGLKAGIARGSATAQGGGYGPDGRAVASNGGSHVNLQQFLPGEQQIRERNGMTGPDGITGPFSSNWKKVRNRYEALRMSLRP